MAITAASVEANGWVLRVTLTGSLSSAIVPGFSAAYATPGQAPDTPAQWATNFSAYALAPSGGAPALTLGCTTAGFVQSGGQAVASSAVPRTLIATKPLRKAVDATASPVTRRPKNPDETDNGDGTITVRIALSQHVYAGDAGLTLTALAGWRTGAGAQTFPVTNNSTVPAPAPIVRWASVPYQLQSGPFALEVVVASHHPNGLAPVAGVKFTVTDGTTVKSYWATALSNSTVVPTTDGTGKNLRVYSVTVDPTVATALTKGLLRCDFKVFPWLGPAKASDTADTALTAVASSNATPSMTGLGTAALATAAQVPFVVAWNPGGSWITPRYAYVSASGATTAAAANVSTNPATAAATPLASINLAIESLRLDAVAHTSYGTVAAANGQAAIAQSLDGCHIRLMAGATLGAGTTAVTNGVQTAATWLVIEGDPADVNPRADCILRTPTSANGTSKVTRVRFANLSVEAGTNTVMGTTVAATWLDNVEVRGAQTPTDQRSATITPFGATGAVLFATNTKWWQYGLGPTQNTTQNPVLLRNVSVERSMNAPAVLNCARLPTAVAGTAGVAGIGSQTTPATDAGAALERLAIGNDLRYLNGANALSSSYLANGSAPTALALGTSFPATARYAWLNNVGETYGTTFPLWNAVGENNPSAASEFIIEGNTFTGDRVNNPYNDLNLATIALNDTTDSICRVFRFANNITMKNASKHDAYADGVVQAQRIGVALSATRNKAYAVGAEIAIAGAPANVYHCTTAGTTAATGGSTGTGSSIADGSAVWQWIATESRQHGYRPQAVSSWASAYGVGYEGNIDFQGPAGPSYDPEFFFEFYGIGSNQLSVDGVDVGSDPFTRDNSGTTQKLVFQPPPDGTGGGNYKPVSTGAGTYILGRAKTANVDVDQAGVVRAATFSAGAIEGVTAVALLPAAGREASHATASATGWTTTVGAGAATMPSRAAGSIAAWLTTVTANAGVLATRAAGSVAGWGASLVAASAALASRATASALAWAGQVAAAPGASASHAAAGLAAWTVTLSGDDDVVATAAAGGTVAWQGGLVPDLARSPTAASVTAVTVVGPWLMVIDSGRIAIVDRTLPLLLPGTTTPPDRTLVATDFRTTCIA